MKTFYKLLIILLLGYGSELALFAQKSKSKAENTTEATMGKKTKRIPDSPADKKAELKISDLTDQNVEVLLPEVIEPKDYTLSEVYDIYKLSEVVAGERVYSDFIDSVYLAKIGKNKLIFNYTWDGEQKYLAKYYVLYPTGRQYLKETKQISRLLENNDHRYGNAQWASVASGFVTIISTGPGYTAENDPATKMFSSGGVRADLLGMLNTFGVRIGVDSGYALGAYQLEVGMDYYLLLTNSFRMYAGFGILPLGLWQSTQNKALLSGYLGFWVFVNDTDSDFLNKLLIEVTCIKVFINIAGVYSSDYGMLNYCAGLGVGYRF